jgi:hypothetical protein
MNAVAYWKIALPYYLKVAFVYSAIGWATPLAITLSGTIWTGLTKHRLAVNRVGVEFALAFGGFFFLLALLTAVGHDIHRNWGAQERIVTWNPLLMWKVFLYLGALVFSVAAFLAYHQGARLSVLFIAFAIGSAIAAKRCFQTSVHSS